MNYFLERKEVMWGATKKDKSHEEYEKRTGYSRFRAWYLVSIMSVSFGLGELSHFLVGSTTNLMAQELHYGDVACFKNATIEDFGNVTCTLIKNETE